MPRLVFRAAARRALAEIAAHIARDSGSRASAENFIDRLTAYCEHLASCSDGLGRSSDAIIAAFLLEAT